MSRGEPGIFNAGGGCGGTRSPAPFFPLFNTPHSSRRASAVHSAPRRAPGGDYRATDRHFRLERRETMNTTSKNNAERSSSLPPAGTSSPLLPGRCSSAALRLLPPGIPVSAEARAVKGSFLPVDGNPRQSTCHPPPFPCDQRHVPNEQHTESSGREGVAALDDAVHHVDLQRVDVGEDLSALGARVHGLPVSVLGASLNQVGL